MSGKEALFKHFRIANCEIKNRYVMVAMGNGGMVNLDGTFNERGIEYFVERARGGVGLIITGTMYVENDIEKVLPGVMPMPILNPNRFIINSSELVERIHAYDCKIFAQLTAGFGRVMTPHLLMSQPISASSTKNFWDDDLECKKLSVDEIHQIIEKCAESAYICKKAGYDGVEIHAVHEGYLLDQFAISLFNKREDEYGGSLENRLKFTCDIVNRIKEKCGHDFPVTIRYSLKSFIKGKGQGGLPNENFKELGRDVEEGLQVAKILANAGYDCIDLDSGSYEGWYWAHPPIYFSKGLNVEYGKMVKEAVDIPIILAGKMNDIQVSIDAIRNNATDMIGIARCLLSDPEYVNKVRDNQLDSIRPCLGCHEGCMNRLVTSKSMSCAVNPASGREKTFALKPITRVKHILIIGAGIAGMEAARVLKLRGHDVQIFEKQNQAGGLLTKYYNATNKEEYRNLVNWYKRELEQQGIDIQYNTEITEQDVLHMNKDIVIIATGSRPIDLKIQGQEVINAEDVRSNNIILKDRVVIVGGGQVGCELALDLAKQNKKVCIIERQGEVLQSKLIPAMNKSMLLDLLKMHHVQVITKAECNNFQDGVVTYKVDSIEREIKAENLINAIGYYSNRKLYEQLYSQAGEIYRIGDAKNVSNIMYAIWDSYQLSNSL